MFHGHKTRSNSTKEKKRKKCKTLFPQTTKQKKYFLFIFFKSIFFDIAKFFIKKNTSFSQFLDVKSDLPFGKHWSVNLLQGWILNYFMPLHWPSCVGGWICEQCKGFILAGSLTELSYRLWEITVHREPMVIVGCAGG